MRIRMASIMSIGIASMGLGGCGSAGTPDAAPIPEEIRELKQVAAIALDGDRTLEFYEVDGVMVLSTAGPVNSPPLALDHNLNAVQVFQKMAPERPLPTALVEAQARVEALHRDSDRLKLTRPPRTAQPEPAPSDIDSQQSAVFGDDDSLCPWTWFSHAFCPGDTQICLGFVDGAKSAERDDVEFSGGRTCSYRQGHNHLSQYKTWFSWTAQGTWFVAPGTWRQAEHWDGVFDFDARVVVQLAGSGQRPGSHIALQTSDDPLRPNVTPAP